MSLSPTKYVSFSSILEILQLVKDVSNDTKQKTHLIGLDMSFATKSNVKCHLAKSCTKNSQLSIDTYLDTKIKI